MGALLEGLILAFVGFLITATPPLAAVPLGAFSTLTVVPVGGIALVIISMLYFILAYGMWQEKLWAAYTTLGMELFSLIALGFMWIAVALLAAIPIIGPLFSLGFILVALAAVPEILVIGYLALKIRAGAFQK